MVYSLVVRACGLEYGSREFESRSFNLKPETKLREERGLSGCRKGLKIAPLAQALLSLKPAKTTKTSVICVISSNPHFMEYKGRQLCQSQNIVTVLRKYPRLLSLLTLIPPSSWTPFT